MELSGFCEPKFAKVREAFLANFERGEELGAAAAMTIDGKPVVDLWAGDAVEGGPAWQEDTIVNVYSTTKTMAAICMLMLADRGQLDFDAPVARYWPEFAAAGKQDLLVRHVMSHSAGLCAFDPPAKDPSELYDWDAMVQRLAAQSPWWQPGDGSGYHPITQGFLQGEILRRIDGRSLGNFFREEVAEPLGADFHIGLDPKHDHRVGELLTPNAAPAALAGNPDSIAAKTFSSMAINGTEPRSSAWRRAEIPAAGGIGNARAVARVHAALACGGSLDGSRLMSEATVARILDVQTDGIDRVLGMPLRFGMGFARIAPPFPINPERRAFFWGGWGGSIAVVDLEARMSICYVMNKMAPELMGDIRGGTIVLAAYDALDALS